MKIRAFTPKNYQHHPKNQAWEFTLLDASQVGNSLGWPAYQWMPDGHLSTLWVDPLTHY